MLKSPADKAPAELIGAQHGSTPLPCPKNNTLYNTLSPASGKSALLPTSNKTRINTGLFKDLKRLFFLKNAFRPGSSPLAPTIFCSNVYAQLLLTFRLCVSIKTKYFVLIILILATRSQTPLLRQIRFVQSCIPSISHCRGVQMHTDLRRVFSSAGSFDCQGSNSEIKKALQTSI